MKAWDFTNIDGRLLDVFDSLMEGEKDARILDAACGTGLSGIEVQLLYFFYSSVCLLTEIPPWLCFSTCQGESLTKRSRMTH